MRYCDGRVDNGTPLLFIRFTEMSSRAEVRAVSEAARAALPLTFAEHDADYDALFQAIGEARVVLIGEASHGTHDFYRERARITRRLIEEKGFCAVAAEADWPDAYRLNRFVLGDSKDTNAVEALEDFERFPAWMWRNMDVVAFAEWLRAHNRKGHNCAGFYGLDLYSLHASAHAVLQYLDKADPAAAARARYRYRCFEEFGEDTQAYGYAASFGITESCEKAVLEQLVELQRKRAGSWPHGTDPARAARRFPPNRMRCWCAMPNTITAPCLAAA